MKEVKVGVYRCRNEQCPTKFFRSQPEGAVKGRHYSQRAIERALAAVGQDKTTFTGATSRLERDFNISPEPCTVYRWFHESADRIDLTKDYEAWAVQAFSGALAIDELYDDFAIFVATDPLNDRTLSVHLCQTASTEELQVFLDHLKNLGVEPKVIVTDGSALYKEVPFRVWPGAKHQLCTFHFIRPFTRAVLDSVRALRRKLPDEPLGGFDSRQLWKERFIFVSRKNHLSPDRLRLLNELTAKYPSLQMVRQFMDEIFALFEEGQSPQQALKRRDEILKNKAYHSLPHLKKVLRSLKSPTFEKAITFLDYVNCPRTTNHVERTNRWYRKRAKSHYRNRTKKAIWNMIKTDLLIRKAHWNRPSKKLTRRQPF